MGLATLAVGYREAHASFVRMRPAAPAKAADGPRRSAAWLEGHLAITGADLAIRPRDGELVTTSRPYGLRLFDPATGSLHTLDAEATEVTVGGGLLLAHGTSYDGTTDTVSGSGLTAYRADGTRAWHLFDDAPVETLFVHGGDAYVWARAQLHAVELATGRMRVTVRPPGMVLLLGGG